MTRKKSRPTHRENASAVPSNEVGLYKMFWNSMETNPGTNGPNSPSQGNAPVGSAVIIINDSPADSPCAVDENSCENPAVPLPIKEEIRESVEGNSQAGTTPENVQESHPKINGDGSSLQTCLPGNPLTSPSKNSSPSSFQSNLITMPQNENVASITPVSTCVDISSSIHTSSNEPNSGNSSSSEKPQATEENGDPRLKQIKEDQVCGQVTTEDSVTIFSEKNISKVVNNVYSPTADVNSSQSCSTFVPNKDISNALTNNEGISEHSGDSPISREVSHDFSSHTEITDTPICSSEIPDETPMDVILEPQSVSRVNYKEAPADEHISDNIPNSQFSTLNYVENNEENTAGPPMNDIPDVGKTLSLLQSLLNAPDEDLEAMSGLPALIGHHTSPDPNEDDEQMDEFGLEQDSTYHNHVDVSSMDIAHSTIMPENIVPANASHPNQTVDIVVDEEHAEFPVFSSNFLPRKIKLDSIGVSRSVKFFKERVRALYKEYLNDDVILRTVIEPQPPVVHEKDTSDDVEEAPSFPPVNVYPICCVKMERLPDPFVKKSTVVMSDDTFKTWKKQIIRQRNEDKFRHLKVWRRGRTLLWRECELAGMDQATYDEQVAYVKKHKLNENSVTDDDASENESGIVYHSNQCDSSREGSSEEETEDSELSSMNLSSSPMKTFTSQATASVSETSFDSHLPENEYVVESSASSQSSPSKTPSALKITIRKASMSRSEDDPTEGEENFTVPTEPSIHKPRKIATKRTFRRPSDPTTKTSAPTKSTGGETKKSKPVEHEDLYDQSLLGRRSHEVENFNLLEKWDIPFEAPTLFRSPRAASRLAQLKTKEAFAPSKKHAPSKTTLTPAVTASNTISKEVKDVVDMLCSKTVEAMLFPKSNSVGSKKLRKTDDGKSVDIKDPASHEVLFKPSMPIEESNILDESSEFSQSETNSTIDASSDFGGSTTSLLSEDLAPPKKSPPKSRRRRRIGPAWNKKKKTKGKGKATEDQLLNERSEGNDEYSANDITRLPETPTENLVAQKATGQVHAQKDQDADKPIQKVGASAHSTQVPVVSEGPGQSPRGSEDDSGHKVKEQISKIKLFGKSVEVKTAEKSQPNKTVQQEVVSPRLTRSKQPTVELDPDLLENFGTRKRKIKTDLPDDASQDGDSKKPKQQDTKNAAQKSKVQSIKPGTKVSTDLLEDDDSNTQVPEVSEGPGEVALDLQDKQGHEDKVEVQEPSVRMLRSRSRGPCSTKTTTSAAKDSSDGTKMNQPSIQEEDKTTDRNQIVELESPQSPLPETAEPDAIISSRITRSKNRRSGPASAYVVVRTTESALISVGDVFDSIAGDRLPNSKLFDASANASSLASGPITSFRVQTNNTPLIDGKVPPAVQSLDRSQNQPPDGSTEEQNQVTSPVNSGEPQGKAVGEQSAHIIAQGGDSKSLEATNSSNNLQIESAKPAAEVLDTLKTIIAITSPKKTRHPVNTSSSLVPPPLSSSSIQTPPLSTFISPPSSTVNNISSPPILNTTQPAFPAQDINSILPGTFLNSFFTNTLDATFSNDINESSLADDPGDLVIDESDANEPDVSFWDNLTNADFSDDDNNTDLADKIDKIIKDQIHQDPVPVPTLKPKVTDANSSSGGKKAQEESLSSKTETDKTASSLNRKDSIDERTGLPNNFLQRLRDPRIRSRLLSHLEEVETADKTPQSGSVVGQNSLPANIVTSSTAGGLQSATVGSNDHMRKVSYPSVCTTVGASQASVSAVSALPTQPVMGMQLETTVSSAVTAVPNATVLTTPLVQSGNAFQQPLVPQGTPIESVGNLDTPEEPPDPSKVDFLVPPSDGEEDDEECIKRRPKKAKKQVDVELMYKSPLEDLQAETRPAYGERAPRRYGENLPRRKSDDRRARWDDRRSRIDDYRDSRPPRDPLRDRRFEDCGRDHSRDRTFDHGRSQSRDRRFGDRGRSQSRDRRFEDSGRSQSRDRRFEERGRSQSRDRRFEDRGRSHSRDRRFEDRERDQSRDQSSFYDRPPRDHSRDQRSYDPWSVIEPAYNQPPPSPAWVMQHPEASHWQQYYQPEPNIPPQPTMYFPDLPKIDYMETRLINLELLPKTTNLEVPSIKKMYAQFDKETVQMLQTPLPAYDPNEQPETIQVLDPVNGEIIEVKRDPKPTSGLTKDFFRHVPPDLTLDDVVKFHFISPAYVMVHDNEEDLDSSSDEEGGSEADSERVHFRRLDRAERKKRALSIKPLLESPQKQVRETLQGYEPHEPPHDPMPDTRNPLKDILENLPYLKASLSWPADFFQSKPALEPTPPPPPPPPEWNDVDLRMSRGLVDTETEEPVCNPSPLKSAKKQSMSRSRSPCRRRSPSPRKRRRSRSRSVSLESDMSISPSRSNSRSPSHSRKGSRTSRRRRSRSRSSERSRSRRSSPKRH